MPRRARPSAWTTRTEQVLTRAWRPKRAVLLVLAGLAVVAGIGAVLRIRQSPEEPRPVSGETVPETARPEAVPAPASALAVPERLAAARLQVRQAQRTPMTERQVADLVARRNAQEQAETARFAADGWTPVALPPPDAQVLSLDPSLLLGHETELRHHLETNSIGGQQLENAATIAVEAEEARTRTAAIQALGRSRAPRAQELLRQLFDDVEDDGDRRLVLGYVRPATLTDPAVDWLLGKLTEPHLADEFKKQMSFSLVLAEIAESGENHEKDLPKLLQRVPQEWRQQVQDAYRTITSK
jgi:hypothetical protein